jgi:hypothetical protein
MISINSTLENREAGFANVNDYLGQFEFTLGGNWEYDHGYFDRYLDEEHKLWIRIPFTVTRGTFDGVNDASDAVVKLGRPFVLKHLYTDGLDKNADAMMVKALVDQFQTPVDKDAPVEPQWVSEAESLLRKVEQGLVH